MLAIVGDRLLNARWAPGVTVVMPRQLVAALRAIPPVLDARGCPVPLVPR